MTTCIIWALIGLVSGILIRLICAKCDSPGYDNPIPHLPYVGITPVLVFALIGWTVLMPIAVVTLIVMSVIAFFSSDWAYKPVCKCKVGKDKK